MLQFWPMPKLDLPDGDSIQTEGVLLAIFYEEGSATGWAPVGKGQFKRPHDELVIFMRDALDEQRQIVGAGARRIANELEGHDVRVDRKPKSPTAKT
jgi:hypothetical protein